MKHKHNQKNNQKNNQKRTAGRFNRRKNPGWRGDVRRRLAGKAAPSNAAVKKPVPKYPFGKAAASASCGMIGELKSSAHDTLSPPPAKATARRADSPAAVQKTEIAEDEAGQTKMSKRKGGRLRLVWKNPRITGAVAAVLLFAMLVAALIPTSLNVKAEEQTETAGMNPTMQLAKEYIYAGSRMLAIEDYGLSSGSTPTPTPTPTSTITPTPTPVLKPDLVITSFSITPASPVEGEAVNFSTTIANQGQASTPNDWTSVLYKIDGVSPGVDGTWAGTTTSIAPGQSVTFSQSNIPWTAVVGSHTLTAFVDDQNRFGESDETNNLATLNINVNSAPTPTPTPPTPTPTPTPAPAVPSIASVTPNADPTCLDITLNGVSGADSYNVKILNSGYTINVTNLSFPWCGLAPATYYEYQAQAINQYGTSGWSQTVGGTTANPPPPATNNSSPVGNFDGIDGNLIVTGWSYDPDDPNNSNDVHVYIGGPAGGGGTGYAVTANQSRPDVNNAFGIGGNHGFSFQIPAQHNTGQWTPVYVYGIDRGTNSPTLLQGSPQYFGTEPEPTPCVSYPSDIQQCEWTDGWWDYTECRCRYGEQKSDQNQQSEKSIWDSLTETVSGWFK